MWDALLGPYYCFIGFYYFLCFLIVFYGAQVWYEGLGHIHTNISKIFLGNRASII